MEKCINDKNLMPKEQKVCCIRPKECKDQLILFKAILREDQRRKKHLCMAWTDYQKVSDSVTHSWIIKYLELIGINNKIILFTKNTMSSCKSIVLPYAEEKLIGTEDTEVGWGMFECDSLSPLLFCVSLIPVTERLTKVKTG
jgi:hypothetical protein